MDAWPTDQVTRTLAEVDMLSDHAPMPTLAVTDMDRSRAFYERVLGFTPVDEDVPDGVRYQAGGGSFLVYPSAFAGTNQATAMSFEVDRDEFDQEAARLRDAGVTFDTFEMDGVTWEDGVATVEGSSAIWFHDPDGNILNVMARAE
jgi:catechol 2,3-dioxygenase-like lactoylglutathione lyase family enzyme